MKKIRNKNNLKKLAMGMTIVSSLFAFSNQVEAKDVTVYIPKFDVTLNGLTVDSSYSEYPVITYSNVTYIPMTTRHAAFLGLDSNWDNSSQTFSVSLANSSSSSFEDYKQSSKNGSSYTATVPTYTIKVNGKARDNANETYPLLNFRGVTYFPLAWEYTFDEFNWQSSWDSVNGLVISSGSGNYTNTNTNTTITTNTADVENNQSSTTKTVKINNTTTKDDTSGGVTAGTTMTRDYHFVSGNVKIDFAESTFGSGGRFTITKDGKTVEYSISEQLYAIHSGEFYFNSVADNYEGDAVIPESSLTGDIFKFPAWKQTITELGNGVSKSSGKNVYISLNIATGKVVDVTEY